MVELTSEDLSYFEAFEKVTGVIPKDYINSDSMILFIVDPQEVGKAISKDGVHITKLKNTFRKKVSIIADAEDPESFVRQFFNNIGIVSVEVRDVMGEQAVMLTIDEKDRGLAIGKEGERIKALKLLLKKKFNGTIHLRTKRSI